MVIVAACELYHMIAQIQKILLHPNGLSKATVDYNSQMVLHRPQPTLAVAVLTLEILHLAMTLSQTVTD
jgi:hypothetical protein